MEKLLRKLTEDEKQKIIYTMNDYFAKYSLDESSESEYITEYDILMRKKEEEFKLHLLNDNEPYEIDALMEMCEDYINNMENPKEKALCALTFSIMYDMWINNSFVWSVMHSPEWEEWNNLKDKKVKRNDKK